MRVSQVDGALESWSIDLNDAVFVAALVGAALYGLSLVARPAAKSLADKAPAAQRPTDSERMRARAVLWSCAAGGWFVVNLGLLVITEPRQLWAWSMYIGSALLAGVAGTLWLLAAVPLRRAEHVEGNRVRVEMGLVPRRHRSKPRTVTVWTIAGMLLVLVAIVFSAEFLTFRRRPFDADLSHHVIIWSFVAWLVIAIALASIAGPWQRRRVEAEEQRIRDADRHAAGRPDTEPGGDDGPEVIGR